MRSWYDKGYKAGKKLAWKDRSSCEYWALTDDDDPPESEAEKREYSRGVHDGCERGLAGLHDLGIHGSTTAIFDARARLGEALEHVSVLRRLLATAELSCSVMKKHYVAAVALLRKTLTALNRFDRTDFDASEQAYAVQDARQVASAYNRTLDEMLAMQHKLDASCSKREPIYRR